MEKKAMGKEKEKAVKVRRVEKVVEVSVKVMI